MPNLADTHVFPLAAGLILLLCAIPSFFSTKWFEARLKAWQRLTLAVVGSTLIGSSLAAAPLSRRNNLAELPPGTIVAWAPLTDQQVLAPPAGWATCDGSPGTPDLTHRFIYGGTSQNAGTTGGSKRLIIEEEEFYLLEPLQAQTSKFDRGDDSAAIVSVGQARMPLPPVYRVIFIIKLEATS